jgi:hypothetical protein
MPAAAAFSAFVCRELRPVIPSEAMNLEQNTQTRLLFSHCPFRSPA